MRPVHVKAGFTVCGGCRSAEQPDQIKSFSARRTVFRNFLPSKKRKDRAPDPSARFFAIWSFSDSSVLRQMIALRIKPVSIVGCFAACSETAFLPEVMGLPPHTLLGALPQTPPGTSVRETRIVVPQAALLAISDAPPACFRHWRRQAPIPSTPSSLRAVLSSFAVYASQNFTCVGCATPSMKTWQTFVLISKQLPSMTTTSASLPTSSEPTRSSMPM